MEYAAGADLIGILILVVVGLVFCLIGALKGSGTEEASTTLRTPVTYGTRGRRTISKGQK